MKIKILRKLKEHLNPYTPFWDEWKQYKHNKLNGEEIQILQTYLKSDFIIEDFKEFLNHLLLLDSIVEKLQKTYPDFQEWLILKFQTTIIKLGYGKSNNVWYELPFRLYPDLSEDKKPLPDRLIKILEKFKCESMYDVFYSNSEADFRTAEKFSIVIEFMDLYKRKEKVLNERDSIPIKKRIINPLNPYPTMADNIKKNN